MRYLVNTSVIPTYGNYTYEKIEENRFAAEMEFFEVRSAIGHPATTLCINAILKLYNNVQIDTCRSEIHMGIGDIMYVFKLKKRLPEGVIIDSVESLNEIGYSFGLITRTY